MNSQQYFAFFKDLFTRFVQTAWQCAFAHEAHTPDEDAAKGTNVAPYTMACGVQPDPEMNTNSCMSSVSTETADATADGTFSREEWDSFSSQCIMKTSTHVTWLFPQYFSFVKVLLALSPKPQSKSRATLSRVQSASFSHSSSSYPVAAAPFKHTSRHPTKIRAAKSSPALITPKPAAYTYPAMAVRTSDRVPYGYSVPVCPDDLMRAYSSSPCPYSDVYPASFYPAPAMIPISRAMSRDSCNPALSCPSTIYPSVSQEATFPAISPPFVPSELPRTTMSFEPFNNPYAPVMPIPFPPTMVRETAGCLTPMKYSFDSEARKPEGVKDVTVSPGLSGNVGMEMKPINSEVVELVHTSSSAVAMITPITEGGGMSPLRPEKGNEGATIKS